MSYSSQKVFELFEISKKFLETEPNEWKNKKCMSRHRLWSIAQQNETFAKDFKDKCIQNKKSKLIFIAHINSF